MTKTIDEQYDKNRKTKQTEQNVQMVGSILVF